MDFDIAVIGTGPAGYVAAIRAAQLGAKVCAVEHALLGGVCLNWGCIPTKTLVETALLLEKTRRFEDYGIAVENPRYDFTRLQQRKESIVLKLRDGIAQLFRHHKIEIIEGTGRLTDKNTISIEGKGTKDHVRASKTIIASGSEPQQLESIPFDGKHVLSSTHILELDQVPESLLVVGGGVIGCEFASIFHSFGTKVTIVEIMDQLLPNEDTRMARTLQASFKRRGISLHLKSTVKKITTGDGLVHAILDDGTEIDTEKALVSVGRRLSSANTGVESCGVKVDRGAIITNDRLETNVPGIYAAGDVTGISLLAHTAHHQGICVAENACGMDHKMSYDVIPSCIYTLPEAGSVGLTESAAKEKGISPVVGRFPFAASSKAVIAGETEGFAQIVAESGTGRILGAQVIGIDATNLLSEIAVLLTMGATVEDIAQTIHPHPTLSEVWLEAALDAMGRALHIISRKK
jgi:dihydrolipoamide dehydrogenase